MRSFRKSLAYILALAVCLCLWPAAAFAEGKDGIVTGKETRTSQPDSPVLTFSSVTPFELSTANHAKNWNGIIEYSTDKVTWRVWDGTTTLVSRWHNNQERLYLRGSGNTRISNGEEQRWVLDGIDHPAPNASAKTTEEQTRGPKVSCTGNIEYLLHYHAVEAGNHPTMAAHCFDHLFYKCNALVKAPRLPAETLTPYCYRYMFGHCESLAAAPKLPSETLAEGCYEFMFMFCTSLKEAPELPAETMADSCYSWMFHSCTALEEAPVLAATELAEFCYEGMFYRCFSLRTAPDLPADVMKTSCYNMMFSDCTSLLEPPSLPSVELAPYCYAWMFQSCTSLYKLPALPAVDLPNGCYWHMFHWCRNIKLSEKESEYYNIPYRIPISENVQSVGNNSVSWMFSQTGGPFLNTPELDTVYYLHRSQGIVW